MRVVPERLGDVFGLVDHAAAHRADIDLDEPDDVRILRLDELVIPSSTRRLERR